MIIKGINYGLTFLYSYMLPMIHIEETASGFRFGFKLDRDSVIDCIFREDNLETTCSITISPELYVVNSIMGIERHHLFYDICEFINRTNCISRRVSLVYSPLFKTQIAFTIYLSRNTDYFTNTIRWMKELLATDEINSSSYQVKEFRRYRQGLAQATITGHDYKMESIELLKIPGFGVKSVNAYLLHAYGLTRNAPIDTYYARFLGLSHRASPRKEHCVSIHLDCLNCSKKCPYHYAISRYGVYNGVLQSLVYILERLKKRKRSDLEEILVRDPSVYIDELEKEISLIKTSLNSRITSE